MIYILKFCRYPILAALAYFAFGFYNNNFYRYLIQNRESVTRATSPELRVATLASQEVPTGFLTGAELAEQAINGKTSGRMSITEVDYANDADSASALDSVLRRDSGISVVVADAPAGLGERLAVICESYGVGLILLNSDPPFLNSRGFHYVAKAEPSYNEYCQTVIDHLGQVCGRPARSQLRLGLFFDQTALGSDTLVNSFLALGRTHNEIYSSSKAIEKAVSDGVLTGDQTLESLRDTFFLQTGVPIEGSALSSYLRNKGLDTSHQIQEALAEQPRLKNPLKFNFVQGFDPSRLDPGRLMVATKSAPLDCVVLVGRLPKCALLLRHLRSLKVTVPIICVDNQSEEWVKSNLAGVSDQLFLVSALDPDRHTTSLDEFRSRFRQRATDLDRSVKLADQAGVLGYETLTTLAELVEQQGAMAPIDLMTLLGFEGAKWPGLSSDFVGFDATGEGIGRKLILTTMKDGAFVSLKEKEE